MATGHGIWILLTGIVGGVLGELILKKGQYKSAKSARMAFTIQSIYTVGNWLPVYFARDSYIKQMIDMGYGEEFTQKMMRVLPDWSLIPLVLFGMLGTFIGCTVGIKILKKHLQKKVLLNDKWKKFFKIDFRTKILMSVILSYTLILGNIQQNHPIVQQFILCCHMLFYFGVMTGRVRQRELFL